MCTVIMPVSKSTSFTLSRSTSPIRKPQQYKSRMRRGNALSASWETFPASSSLPVSLPKDGMFGAMRSNAALLSERPANESQVGISRFQVRKKATRNQTAERSKIETAVGQRGVQYEIRSAPVCLDKQLPRRSRYAGTCWQKPSCRPCKAFLRNAFCP